MSRETHDAVTIGGRCERHDIEIPGVVTIPGVVALRRRDDAGGVATPTDPAVLELARGEVAGCAGAVRGHDVDMVRPVEDPVLAVEAAEESLDLAGRLPRGVLGLVALVTMTAGERDPLPVGRPRHVAEPVGHRAHGAHLTGHADRQNVQRRVALLLAAPRGEGEKAAIRRPTGAAVVIAGGHGCVVEPQPGARHVLRQIDGGHDERHVGTVGTHCDGTDAASTVDHSLCDRPMVRWALRGRRTDRRTRRCSE